jgi:hypothetical protein
MDPWGRIYLKDSSRLLKKILRKLPEKYTGLRIFSTDRPTKPLKSSLMVTYKTSASRHRLIFFIGPAHKRRRYSLPTCVFR